MKKIIIIYLSLLVTLSLFSCAIIDKVVFHYINVEKADTILVNLDKEKALFQETVNFSVEIDNSVYSYTALLLYDEHTISLGNDNSFVMPNSDVTLKIDIFENKIDYLDTIGNYEIKKAPLPIDIENPDVDNLSKNPFPVYENSIELISFEHITTSFIKDQTRKIYSDYETYEATNYEFGFTKELFDNYFVYIDYTFTRTEELYSTFLTANIENDVLNIVIQNESTSPFLPRSDRTYEVYAYVFEKINGNSPRLVKDIDYKTTFSVIGTVAQIYFDTNFHDRNFPDFYKYIESNNLFFQNLVNTYPILNEYELNFDHSYLNFVVSKELIENQEFQILFQSLLNDQSVIYYELQNELENYYFKSDFINDKDSISIDTRKIKDGLYSYEILKDGKTITSFSEFNVLFPNGIEIITNSIDLSTQKVSYYDEEFFKNNDLYIFSVFSGSGADIFTNIKVEYDNDSINISYKTLLSDALTEDIKFTLFFVPIIKNNTNIINVSSNFVYISNYKPSKVFFSDRFPLLIINNYI